MNVTRLPGTTIDLPSSEYSVRGLLSSLFLAEGLVLSQVSSLTGLPPHILQNWVKREFLPPPVHKKYSKRQFCRIAIINFLKDSLQIDSIVKLIGAVNGKLADSADDLIDDSELYCYFVETLTRADADLANLPAAIQAVLGGYAEPYPGARKKVAAVLRIMGILYISSQIRLEAEILLKELNL